MRKFEYMSRIYRGDKALTALGAEGWKAAGILAPGKGRMPPVILLEREVAPTAEEEFIRRFGHPAPRTKSDVVREVAAKHGVPVIDDLKLSEWEPEDFLGKPTNYATDEVDYITQADEQPSATPAEQAAFHDALVTRGVWTAGWNIPGYLPDEPAQTFSDWYESVQYLDNELEHAGDDFAHDDGEQTIVDQYAVARQLLDQSEPDQAFYARVGNYVWWIERVIHPDES